MALSPDGGCLGLARGSLPLHPGNKSHSCTRSCLGFRWSSFHTSRGGGWPRISCCLLWAPPARLSSAGLLEAVLRAQQDHPGVLRRMLVVMPGAGGGACISQSVKWGCVETMALSGADLLPSALLPPLMNAGRVFFLVEQSPFAVTSSWPPCQRRGRGTLNRAAGCWERGRPSPALGPHKAPRVGPGWVSRPCRTAASRYQRGQGWVGRGWRPSAVVSGVQQLNGEGAPQWGQPHARGGLPVAVLQGHCAGTLQEELVRSLRCADSFL